MASFPRCAAHLRDGQHCLRTVVDGSEFCVHHAKLAESHGAEAVERGMPRRRTSRSTSTPPLVVADEPARGELEQSNGHTADPATVRPRLAEAAAESVDDIRRALLDAATGATKDHWVTFECSECGSRSRVQLPVPDVRARVAAIELLLREGLGRPPQAEETAAPRLPATASAVSRMGWEELQILAVTMYADEIAAVASGNGLEHLREQLARMSEGSRRVLRAALADIPA
jgi:hypothetical protein